jgi:hypothetical protein
VISDEVFGFGFQASSLFGMRDSGCEMRDPAPGHAHRIPDFISRFLRLVSPTAFSVSRDIMIKSLIDPKVFPPAPGRSSV